MEEYREIEVLVARGPHTAFPVHNWKYAPILAKAIEYIAAGRLGEVLHSEFHTLRFQPAEGLTSWRDNAKESGGGGILMDHGWHGIYILCNLARSRPVAVTAWVHPPRAAATERSAHVLLDFEASTASLYLTWEASQRFNSARIYGTKGTIRIEDHILALTTQEGQEETLSFPLRLSNGSHHPDWFDAVIREFMKEINSPDRRGDALKEVLTCLECTLKAYASAEAGGRRMPLRF
jgi:predicted dehydrogenase